MKRSNYVQKSLLSISMAVGLLTAAPLILTATNVRADYPERPIKLLVGFRAGGRIDSLARIVAKELTKDLGQPVVVESKPGGGGAVMASELANAEPNGYTLGMSVSITWAFNPFYQDKAPYGFDQFDYLATISEGKPALFSNPDSGWETLSDLIVDAKKRDKPLVFASLSPSTRLQINSIARTEGVKFRILPARGGSEVLPMILGGNADFAFSGGFHHSYALAGKVNVLANTGTKPFEDLPEVRTLEELGYESFPADYILLAAPKGMPDEVKDLLYAALNKVVRRTDIRERLLAMDAPPALHGPAKTEEIMKQQASYYNRLIQAELATD